MNTAFQKLWDRFYKKSVSVIGIGVSNTPVIDLLLSMECTVTARDKRNKESMGALAEELQRKGVRLVLGEGYLDGINDDFIIKTPGIRYDHPSIAAAVERGSVLSSEMEQFFDVCPAKIVAVTGSDGKTTTTTLISEMLKAQREIDGHGGRVFLGGNIGKPLLCDAPDMTENDVAVLELSSFQLHTMKSSPSVAVLTNVTPNHLDYHIDMKEYTEAKTNIFKYQNDSDRVVLNADNAQTASFAEIAPSRVCFFSTALSADDMPKSYICAYLAGDTVVIRDESGDHPIIERSDILLPGIHNVQNYMAASLALWGSVSADAIRTVAKRFGGVEHRLEFVREKDGVRYYNSSIDTSPTRTAAALRAFDLRPVVICGGYDKHIPFEPLADVLIERASAVVLTGATAEKIGDAVMAHKDFDFKALPLYFESEFHEAVKTASRIARPGGVVILSPACASFDAFENFASRGRFFKKLVSEL